MHELLDPKTVPAQIPARAGLLQKLAEALAPIGRGTVVDLELAGPTGTGKSTTVRALLASFGNALALPGSIDHVVIDCRASLRTSAIVTALLQAFCPAYPVKGFSLELMLQDVTRLVKTRGKPLLVVLDDHHLLRDGVEPLRALMDLRTRHQLPLSLVVVREMPLAESIFPRILVHPYTGAQARAIVAARARAAGLRLSPGTIQVLAGACSLGGMKRTMLALQACAVGGQTNKAQAVLAVATCDARFNQERLQAYTDHHLFILRSLCQTSGPVRSRRLRDAYWAEAQSRHEKPLANVQFLKYVAQLARAGFLQVKPLRGGVPGGALSIELVCNDRHVALAEVEKALDSRGA